MKPVSKLNTLYMKQVYADYAEKILKDNPEWWGKYGKTPGVKNCYIYAHGSNGKPVLKVDYYSWKEAMSSLFFKAKDAIIQGETFRLGSNLGKLLAIRIERNFSKPKVNWGATFKANIKLPSGKVKRLYYDGEDYCRISWQKYHMIPNESRYQFDPAERNMTTNKGFKYEFARALDENPLLRYRYKFCPIIRKKSCNTDTAVCETSSPALSGIPG